MNIIKKLYAGDIPKNELNYKDFIGLSLTQNNENHIKCDLTQLPLPFDDSSVDIFQSEDVFEHIEYNKLIYIINDIYRILKPNSLFRLSIPDYNCDILYKRSIYDFSGNIVYDPGGGTFENPGHVWFPNYYNIKTLLENTLFHSKGKIKYLHYWINKEEFIINKIDYSKGYVQRTPDNDKRVQNPYRPMSIIIDLIKT